MSKKATVTDQGQLLSALIFLGFPSSLASTYHGHHRPRVHVLHQPRVEWAVFQVNVVLLQEFLRGLPRQRGHRLVTKLGRLEYGSIPVSEPITMVANLVFQPT